MARPLRIEYPDAYYHVSNKAEYGTTLFPGPKFYESFLAELADACARYNVQVHAYSLLRNEYHILLKTPEGNLSRFMRQLNGLYTQFYQARKHDHGSVFQTRYKAVLIQPKSYLLQVSRHIHNLAGVVKRGAKPVLKSGWSSIAAYCNKAKAPAWLECKEVFAMLSAVSAKKTVKPYAEYLSFVAEGTDPELKRFYARKNQLSILGDDKLKNSARSKIAPAKPRGLGKGRQARLRPSMKKVVAEVSRHYKVSESSIYSSARGPGSRNVPRWVAMYFCQELSALTLQDIADRFGLKHYGTVSTTIGKPRREMQTDPKLGKAIRSLNKRLKTQI
jgi:putative transposase